MEGLLCRWALALQEYSFTIVYRRGALNANVDSLSRCSHKNITSPTAATFCSIGIPPQTLQAAQQNDPVTSAISDHLSRSSKKPTDTKGRKQPLYHYVQLWSQLLIVDDIVCHRYSPSPDLEMITVPVFPQALQQDALYQAHNTSDSGHQGQDRTLQKLRLIVY